MTMAASPAPRWNVPALKRLLRDIEAGLVDVVVVYKIDRLSRSLMDFSKLVDVFDANNVTFVSVTQSFSTTTSMGRLTLNILLSFAQFEREVIGERIRDKFAASRRKGMWMGGYVPLGYRLENRKLLVEENEAATVRMIFERFLTIGSATILARTLHAEGVTMRNGRQIDKGYLYKLLNNRIYVGDAVHKGTAYPGEHTAIISQELWDKVHSIIAESPRNRAAQSRAQTPALLKGLIFGPTGCAMSPTHTRKGGKLYRYYVSQSVLKQGRGACPVGRLPAAEIETAVIDQLRSLLRTPEVIVATWKAGRQTGQRHHRGRGPGSPDGTRSLVERAVSGRAGAHRPASGRARGCGDRRHLDLPQDRRADEHRAGPASASRHAPRRSRMSAVAEVSADGTRLTVRVPMNIRRRGGRKVVVAPAGHGHQLAAAAGRQHAGEGNRAGISLAAHAGGGGLCLHAGSGSGRGTSARLISRACCG